jgi:hypothetical protein
MVDGRMRKSSGRWPGLDAMSDAMWVKLYVRRPKYSLAGYNLVPERECMDTYYHDLVFTS